MKERIIDLLCSVNEDIRNNLDSELLASGIINSFQVVNMVLLLEEEFNIEIGVELIVSENFHTVDAIVAMVEKILNEV